MEGCATGPVLRGSATTTTANRRSIRTGSEILRVLAKRHGVNPRTVAKWRKRRGVEDLPTGSGEPQSTSLSPEDEAVVVAFRRRTPPPLDDRLYALQPSMPLLTRSSLHRCLHRHGISRLPETSGDKPSKKRFRYDDHAQRQRHLSDFIDACDFARRLKALRGLTPYAFICKTYADAPQSFRIGPRHQSRGANISGRVDEAGPAADRGDPDEGGEAGCGLVVAGRDGEA